MRGRGREETRGSWRNPLPGVLLVGWRLRPQSHPACGFASSFFLSRSTESLSPRFLRVSETPQVCEGTLPCLRPPREVTATAECVESLGRCPFCRQGHRWGARGENVSCSSLLKKMLTRSHSTFGKCSEHFYSQCPDFSGFRKVLLLRKKVLFLLPSLPRGVTAHR